MKGNRNDGIGLLTAAEKLRCLWKDIKSVNPFLKSTTWDFEFNRIITQMRKRAKMIKEGGAE